MLLSRTIGWAAFLWLIHVPDNRPPAVAVRGVEKAKGIGLYSLANLGREQFPEMLAYGYTSSLWVQVILMVAGFACLAFMIAVITGWGRANGLHTVTIGNIRQAKGLVPPIPDHWAIVVGVSAGLGLLLLLFFNHAYTLMRFPKTGQVAKEKIGASTQRLGDP